LQNPDEEHCMNLVIYREINAIKMIKIYSDDEEIDFSDSNTQTYVTERIKSKSYTIVPIKLV